MHYLTIKETAEKWGVSPRSVQTMCQNGLVDGVFKWGRSWKIPADAEKPADKRTKKGKIDSNAMKMPRKTPFLSLTNLYHTPGKADECATALEGNMEAKMLFEAEIAYSRGEIDKVYAVSDYFLNSHTGFYAVIAGGMLLSLCAMWYGDIDMWSKAKTHISEAPCRNDIDHELIHLSHAAADSSIRNHADFPEWFKRGCFEFLPADAHPAARVFYLKYLLEFAFEVALGKSKMDNVSGVGFMKTLPYVAEPMIAQAMVDKSVLEEIYLRLTIGVVYHNIGDTKMAGKHIDRAVEIALADGLYGTLAEYRRMLGYYLDDKIAAADKEALKKYKELHKQISEGWHKLHNTIMDKTVAIQLTHREREVAVLASFGFSNMEIAGKLGISISSVKSVISMAMNKTGAQNRYEFANYL